MARAKTGGVPREAANQLLDAFPVGVIVLSPTGRVLAANRSATRILDHRDGLALEDQHLQTSDPEETEELDRLVRSTAANGRGDLPGAENARHIKRPSGRRPLSLLVSRVDRSSEHTAGRPAQVAVFVTDPEERAAIPEARLRRLYDLTASEARIASRLAAGLRPEEVAAELGVQTNTVRMHLKRIFAKTGTGRQSQLVSLVLNGPARLATE